MRFAHQTEAGDQQTLGLRDKNEESPAELSWNLRYHPVGNKLEGRGVRKWRRERPRYN